MSCVADANAISQKIRSVICSRNDRGKTNDKAARDRAMTSSSAITQYRFVRNISTNGDQNGLMTQGRYNQLVRKAMLVFETSSRL